MTKSNLLHIFELKFCKLCTYKRAACTKDGCNIAPETNKPNSKETWVNIAQISHKSVKYCTPVTAYVSQASAQNLIAVTSQYSHSNKYRITNMHK